MKGFILFVSFLIIILIGCREEEHRPILKGEGTTEQILDPQVENLPGGAMITYSLPGGADILYVIAQVENKDGSIREFSSSFYSNSITIEGLGNTDTYNVELYTVNKGGDKSDPLRVSITPLKPSYLDVFESLTIEPDFGGITVRFDNPMSTNVGVTLLANDSLGRFDFFDSYFTQATEGAHTFRPFPDEENHFGVYIQDEWGNISDTLFADLTPLFEIMLDKSLFKAIELPGDASLDQSQSYLVDQVKWIHLWDGIWSTDFDDPYKGNGNNYKRILTSDPKTGREASWITIDLGQLAYLSRFRFSNYWQFERNMMKEFEIWGMEDTPPSDGSWDGWVLLASHKEEKPSGLPLGQFDDDDKARWVEGITGNFFPGIPAVRYIRVKCLENYDGNTNMEFEEVTFWGSN